MSMSLCYEVLLFRVRQTGLYPSCSSAFDFCAENPLTLLFECSSGSLFLCFPVAFLVPGLWKLFLVAPSSCQEAQVSQQLILCY